MPIPYTPPVPWPTFTAEPYVIREPQQYAIEQERFRHNAAMYAYGENSMFALMWTIVEFDKGLVGRCPLCSQNSAIADTFKQPAKEKCPNCFGTTFDGGYKALIVRPTIWVTQTDQNTVTRHGEMIINSAQIQSTNDFRANKGDYVFKADGSRWLIDSPATDNVTTGFEPSTDFRNMVGHNYQATRQDESSVAYMIPPPPTVLNSRLQQVHGQP